MAGRGSGPEWRDVTVTMAGCRVAGRSREAVATVGLHPRLRAWWAAATAGLPPRLGTACGEQRPRSRPPDTVATIAAASRFGGDDHNRPSGVRPDPTIPISSQLRGGTSGSAGWSSLLQAWWQRVRARYGRPSLLWAWWPRVGDGSGRSPVPGNHGSQIR